MSRASANPTGRNSRLMTDRADTIVGGLGDPSPYLLNDERVVVAVRRHVMVLAAAFAETLGFIAAAIMIHLLFPYTPMVDNVVGLICLAALVRFGYLILEWRLERFVITDQRMMLVGGVLTRQVAVMPMRKVTDLTFEKPLVGQILGYGTFIVESAGQDQALSRIEYLPRANRLYLKVSDLLFGGHAPRDEGDLPAPARYDHDGRQIVAPQYGVPQAPAGDGHALLAADLEHTDPHLGQKLSGLELDDWAVPEPDPQHERGRHGDPVYQPFSQLAALTEEDQTHDPAGGAELFDAVREPRRSGARMRERLGGLNGRGRRRDEAQPSSGPIQQRTSR